MRYPHSTFVQLMGLYALGAVALGVALVAARGIPLEDAVIVALAAVVINVVTILLGNFFWDVVNFFLRHRHAVAAVLVGVAIPVSLVEVMIDRKHRAGWLLLIVMSLVSSAALFVGWLYDLIVTHWIEQEMSSQRAVVSSYSLSRVLPGGQAPDECCPEVCAREAARLKLVRYVVRGRPTALKAVLALMEHDPDDTALGILKEMGIRGLAVGTLFEFCHRRPGRMAEMLMVCYCNSTQAESLQRALLQSDEVEFMRLELVIEGRRLQG